MTLGRALEKCAFESRWLTGYEPWTQRLAWNLTLASLLCKAERMTSAFASAGIKVDELRVAIDKYWEDLNKHR